MSDDDQGTFDFGGGEPPDERAAAEAAKDAAIAAVEKASQQFCDTAYEVLIRLAREKPLLTSIDVRMEYDRDPDNEPPNHPRAIGPVMLRGIRERIIRAFDRVPSGQISNHNQRIERYESLLYDNQTGPD